MGLLDQFLDPFKKKKQQQDAIAAILAGVARGGPLAALATPAAPGPPGPVHFNLGADIGLPPPPPPPPPPAGVTLPGRSGYKPPPGTQKLSSLLNPPSAEKETTINFFGKKWVLKKPEKESPYPTRKIMDPWTTDQTKDYDKQIDDLSAKIDSLKQDTGGFTGVQNEWLDALNKVYGDRKTVLTSLRDVTLDTGRVKNELTKRLATSRDYAYLKQLKEDADRAKTYEDQFANLQQGVEAGPESKVYAPALAAVNAFDSESYLISTNRQIKAVVDRYQNDPQKRETVENLAKAMKSPDSQMLNELTLGGGPKFDLHGHVEGPGTGGKILKGGGIAGKTALTVAQKYLNFASIPTALPVKLWTDIVRGENLGNQQEDALKSVAMEQGIVNMYNKVLHEHPERAPRLRPIIDEHVAKMQTYLGGVESIGQQVEAVPSTGKTFADTLKLKNSASYTGLINELGNMEPGSGPSKFLKKVAPYFGMALDITTNPATYATGGSTASRLAGPLGAKYNSALLKMTQGVEHPAIQEVARIAEKLHTPATAVNKALDVATGGIASLPGRLAGAAKNQMVSHGAGMAKTFHAQPFMTEAEKMALWDYNLGKSLTGGIVSQTYKTGKKLSKQGEKKAQRDVYGGFYDIAGKNKTGHELGKAYEEAYAKANKSGNLDWITHDLNAMRDIKDMEVPAGFLQHERAAYLPGVLGKDRSALGQFGKNELDRIKQGWRGESATLTDPESALRRFNPELGRSGETFADISAAHPGFVKNPQMAIASRERYGLSRVLGGSGAHPLGEQGTKALVDEGGLLESAEVTSRLLAKEHDAGGELASYLTSMDPKVLHRTELYKTELKAFRSEMKDSGAVKMSTREGNPVDKLAREQMPIEYRNLPVEELQAMPSYQSFVKQIEARLGPGAVAGKPTIDNVWIQKRLADFISNRKTGLSAAHYPTSKLGKIVRKPTDFWRKMATVYMGPKYFLRRAIGDPDRAYKGGIFPSIGDMAGSRRISRGGTPRDLKLSTGKKLSGADAATLTRNLDIKVGGQLWGEGKKLSGINPWTKLWQGAVNKQQEFFRQAEFLKALRKTGEPGSALEAVNRTAFNFGDLSAAEGRLGKSIQPFYAWNRKNVPFQYSAALHNPGGFVPEAALVHALTGKQPNALENFLLPDYVKKAGYIPTNLDSNGQPTFINPQLPSSGMNVIPNFLGDPSDITYTGNPVISGVAEMLMGKTRTGEDLTTGTRPVSGPFGHLMHSTSDVLDKMDKMPWLGKIPGLGKLADMVDAKQGVDSEGNTVWKASPYGAWGLQQIPPAQAANQMLRTDVTDRGQRIASRILPMDILPMNYKKQAHNKVIEDNLKKKAMLDTLDSLKGLNLKGIPGFKMEPLKTPPSPTMLKELDKYNEVLNRLPENIRNLPYEQLIETPEYKAVNKQVGKEPIPQGRLDQLNAAYQQNNLLSPMPGATLADVQNAGKRGYVYSYNKALMTPDQLAAAAAQATGSGGGGGWGRRGGGGGRRGGGGHGGGSAKAKAVKAVKYKKQAKGKKLSSVISAGAALPASVVANAQIPLPSGGGQGGGQQQASAPSLQSLIAQMSAGQGRAALPAAHVPRSTAGGIPPELSAAIQRMLSTFLAGRGGPEATALRSLIEQQGVMSPQVLAMLQQFYNSSAGASVAQ